MRFPLVARSTLGLLEKQNEWLRSELEKALDHNRRLERKELGLSELPAKPRTAREPMPTEVMDYLLGLEPPSIRADTERDFYETYNKFQSWTPVLTRLRERE